MISTQIICAELAQQDGFVSTVELAMILEASASEVRDSLMKLGDRVTRNEHDEWRVAESLVHKLELAPLSEAQRQERNSLEQIVEQSFYNAAMALKTLRDKKLYRETHKRFESYVEDKFGFTKRKAYYLIDAYDVVNNLKSEPMVHFLPTSERQCREVAKLPPQQQPQGWLTSVEKAGGRQPPARIIRQVVKEMKPEESMTESKGKYVAEATEEIVTTPDMPAEYIIRSDRETYELLEEYRLRVGAATKLGAIRRLLENEKAYR